MLGYEPPAFMGLALDVGLASLALGVERVERLVEPFLGGLAGIDCAAQEAGRRHRLECGSPSLRLRAKNRGPDQRVPVMARATSDRLAKTAPSCAKPRS